MSTVKIDQSVTKQVVVYENIDQEVIMVSVDRVKLILIEHNRLVKKLADWVGPVGIFITVLATLLTANFTENKFGIPSHAWQGIFFIVCIITGVWSLIVVINVFVIRSKVSVDTCIANLKAESANK